MVVFPFRMPRTTPLLFTVDKKSVVKQNYENGKNSGCWYYLNRSEKEYTPAVVSFSGKTLDVTKTSLTIKKGKKATIKATAMPKTKITYQSKNKNGCLSFPNAPDNTFTVYCR